VESNVWDTLIEVQTYFEKSFSRTGKVIFESGMDRFNQPGWINRVWSSDTYRRAHVDVVDARETKGLWMMHCCIFPHLHNPAPIFGFDVIAGKNKITGCFYDYSPSGDKEHPMLDYFADEAQKFDWIKTRKLPDWAERIFSGSMVAAANVSKQEELDQIITMAREGVDHYLYTVGETNNTANSVAESQNYYCENQKQNPHTPRVMVSLGLSEDDVRMFIHDCLFPEIK
jgi:phycocyanobilin:ferredoxin oxidoreductase